MSRGEVFVGRSQDAAAAPLARICGRRYTPPGCEIVTGIAWHCDRLPDHAGPHSGDMGAHEMEREGRLAYEFGVEVEQRRAVCACGWRSSWCADARYLADPERRHAEEAAR